MNTRKMLIGLAGTAGAVAMSASAAFAQMTPGTTPQGGATGAATAPSTAPAATGAAGTATAGGGVSQGATVYDTQGGTVGTIESVEGEYAVLATAKNKVRLPKSSFANGPKGPLIAMTAAQLDQEAAKAGGGAAPSATAGMAGGAGATGTTSASATSPGAAPSGKPTVTTGAAVSDTSGGSVGKIAEVKGDLATLELASGSKVQVPTNAFGAGPSGGLVIAMSASQLSAAAAASGGGTSSSSSASGSTSSSGGKTKTKKGG